MESGWKIRLSEINAYNCPEPSLDPPDPCISGYCNKCGGEIYLDEITVYDDGKRMCYCCFLERVGEILKDSPAIVAECLGMRYEEGEID